MANIVTNTIVAGIGVAVRATEKLSELGRSLVEESQLNEDAGSRFVTQIRERAGAAGREVRSEIESRFADLFTQVGLARRDEVDELKRRIAELESQLSA